MASLFKACKDAARDQTGGTFNIGGYDIELELYHQRDIDDGTTLGDNDESKIVVVADDTITIPSGYTLTPNKPKKSLVILCNTLVNNGTISMYQKAPNTLPHDYFIIEKSTINSNKDVIIPAYANNRVSKKITFENATESVNGKNGADRQCGSGGTGCGRYSRWSELSEDGMIYSGSGYAFGGGAGTCGFGREYARLNSVDSTYPMRGSSAENRGYAAMIYGGVGNPTGDSVYNDRSDFTQYFKTQGFGCGGRIIIFCGSFENNGTITVNGTSSITHQWPHGNDTCCPGGASGAGAVDIFYKALVTEGTITATGGVGNAIADLTPGKGGNGSVTLTQWSQSKLYKLEAKYFSQANVDYLLTQLTERIKESRMGE